MLQHLHIYCSCLTCVVSLSIFGPLEVLCCNKVISIHIHRKCGVNHENGECVKCLPMAITKKTAEAQLTYVS